MSSLRPHPLVVGAGLLSALVGVGSTGCATSCTEVGCGSPLVIQISAENGQSLPLGTYAITAVVDGETVECTYQAGGTDASSCFEQGIQIFDAPSGGGALQLEFWRSAPASLSLTIAYEQNDGVTETFEPAYSTSHPNGEDCAPTCQSASEAMVLPETALVVTTAES